MPIQGVKQLYAKGRVLSQPVCAPLLHPVLASSCSIKYNCTQTNYVRRSGFLISMALEKEQPAQQPSAQSPEESPSVRVEPISKVAGGATAAFTAAKFAFGEMGLIRGTRTLLQLNQKQQIDCPGCAWPEPDGKRSHFEFCEEGAKHVADEATKERITPEFFQQWSVPALSQQSDQWLNAQGRITHPMYLREGG